MMGNNYPKRYIAHIVLEANTPLKVGSSDIDMLQDSPIQKDWNGLPMILGTSIVGVLRKSFKSTFADEVFGDEDSKKKDAKGSRIVISNALLCDEDMQVYEGLNTTESDFLKQFDSLPLREHVKINHKGVAENKFDEEVVYKGSRFVFRMEFIADENDEMHWKSLLQNIQRNSFRLGGGTTKGFGEMSVVTQFSNYDLFFVKDEAYSEVSSSLNTLHKLPLSVEEEHDSQFIEYSLIIEPDDFFMFGSGFGDDDADQIQVKEKTIVWDEDKGSFTDYQILMPASSLKGALVHRTAFYYNKTQMQKENNYTPQAVEKNLAVKALFGEAKESDDKLGTKGKVLFSDVYIDDKKQEKVFDHVSIDRFTGGAIEGMLFNEKTVAQKDTWHIQILLENANIDADYTEAFEQALNDITTGMLALGGTTNKGHGIFTGKVLRNGEAL